MRVLIVKTSSMGDVLHTLPALTDAQQAIPGIKFDWVVEEGFAQIPSWHAAVERVIPVAIRRWRKAWFSAPIKAERKAFREALQAENYDAVIDAQGLVKSAALVTRLAHGVKHGLDWQTAREPLASLFYNRKHHIAKQQHAVERAVDNGDDGYKNFLALDLQKIEDQGEADEAAFPRTQSAAHHNHQNKEVDDQLFAPCELTVRRITDHNVCKGNHGNYHGNDAQDHLFDHCQSVHNFLIDFHFTNPFCFFAGLSRAAGDFQRVDPPSGAICSSPPLRPKFRKY